MEELQQQILSWCDTLEEYLKCGQCRGPLIRDTYLCEAGHFVCLTCSQDSPNDKCSICKMKYTKTRNYLAENLAEKMETIRKKIGGNVEDDDDFRSVTSENSNASWNTFPCWIWNCKVQGSIEEIRQHYKESHSGVYVKANDNRPDSEENIPKLEDLDVEVCVNNAYYKASITDVFPEEVSVTFENNWMPQSRFPFSQVRLPMKDAARPFFGEGREVEVKVRANDEAPWGWRRAMMKKNTPKGYLKYVEYLDPEPNLEEIVNVKRLRAKNSNPPIDVDTFHKTEVHISEVNVVGKEEVLQSVQRMTGAPLCRYSENGRVIVAISKVAEGKHCDGKLPHSTSFFLDYSFPRTMDRLLDIPDVGLFLLHVVVYDNGALRAHLLMYDSGRNARKYRYKLKIQCNAQNFSVEGVVDTVRIPKNLLAKKGLFVQRAHNLQIELQKTLKFTCHVEVDRNTQPPEEKASQKLTGARYKSRNQKSTDDQTDSTANTITEDSSDLKKKPQKNFQKNRDKLTNGNPQNSQEKPKNPIPKISNPQKKQNSEAKAENVRKPIKSKSPELQNHQSRVDDPLQTSGGQNSPRQGGFGGNLGGSGGTIPPVFAHPPPFGSMPSYGSQGMGYQSPGGGANYPPGVLPPQGLPSNPHHFGATPGVFPGANPHYRPPPSPGTPEIPGAHHGQPSAPVEDGNGGYVQYPDLTNMKHKMMDEVQRKVIAKERMRGTRTSSTESKDKCVIS
ncbi:uncharacterized protein LOC107039661 isoform X1 [Diachasma alloeum]|uniref:uncharacterized protein LOC107039661 isoform X1 n=1 Tax=Diachasma alloeum TaxID=454923 RepID=UPI000738420D|nr:uncharacterized protein LOC107039661 isoform X1 [Diachasma alloeum]